METSSGDRSIGVQAVYDALSAPLRQISENAGEEPSVVVSKVLENKSESFGYNARNKEYVDLLKEGVIDPVKVTRNALQSAGSIAGLVLTTETLVADEPKPDTLLVAQTWAAWAVWAAWAGWISESSEAHPSWASSIA